MKPTSVSKRVKDSLCLAGYRDPAVWSSTEKSRLTSRTQGLTPESLVDYLGRTASLHRGCGISWMDEEGSLSRYIVLIGLVLELENCGLTNGLLLMGLSSRTCT